MEISVDIFVKGVVVKTSSRATLLPPVTDPNLSLFLEIKKIDKHLIDQIQVIILYSFAELF